MILHFVFNYFGTNYFLVDLACNLQYLQREVFPKRIFIRNYKQQQRKFKIKLINMYDPSTDIYIC